MNIAITQRPMFINGFEYDATARGWYDLLPHHTLVPVTNHSIQTDIDFDMLIISGGENTAERNVVERHYFELAQEQSKPVLGVCHGAFFINEYFEGTTKNIDHHQNIEHDVFLDGKLQTVNSYHKLAVNKLSQKLSVVSRDMSSNIEAFKHKKLSVWGLVWHPERMIDPVLPKDLKELLLG